MASYFIILSLNLELFITSLLLNNNFSFLCSLQVIKVEVKVQNNIKSIKSLLMTYIHVLNRSKRYRKNVIRQILLKTFLVSYRRKTLDSLPYNNLQMRQNSIKMDKTK